MTLNAPWQRANFHFDFNAFTTSTVKRNDCQKTIMKIPLPSNSTGGTLPRLTSADLLNFIFFRNYYKAFYEL